MAASNLELAAQAWLDNTQNDANHGHAVWRELTNDWVEDLLVSHLAAAREP